MKAIQKFLKKHREEAPRSIMCVGDAMVDEYYKVSVNRISPEFPMPIMQSRSDGCERRPGGVANVARQFKFFNVSAKLVCFKDSLLEAVSYDIDHELGDYDPFMTRWGGFTPKKRRYLDGHVQVVRHDIEADMYNLTESQIFEAQSMVKKYLLTHEAKLYRTAILSDYNKGFFQGGDNWIQYFPDSFTIVDPKKAPLSRWEGCEIFKPNCKEAAELSGLNDWKAQSDFFRLKGLGTEAVVITCGDDGVKGVWGGEYFEYIPDKKVRALSVVGAGDCFVAGLALAVSYGFSGMDAIEIAYCMGAQYVQHELNRPITPAELSEDKLVESEDLMNRDYKLVFTNGCFDILHTGHIQTLRFAKEKGDKLVVALNSDKSIERLKGEGRPIKCLEQRAALMAAFEFVDFVVVFDEDDPRRLIEKIKPDVLVKGGQYDLESIIGADIVKEVYRAPMIEGLSTTALISCC